jgi:hypothetical protein
MTLWGGLPWDGIPWFVDPRITVDPPHQSSAHHKASTFKGFV